MINLKDVHPSANKYIDGQLDDGRLVEFKINVPHNMDMLAHIIVAMANTSGGLILFGIDERSMSVVGIQGNLEHLICKITQAINKFSIGITYSLTHEIVDEKNVIILEIMKAESTAFFSRIETTPARQIAYKFKKEAENQYTLLNESEMRYSKVYKYMTLEAFLTSLYCRTWRFFEPSKWNDKFEQRFYCANYTFPEAVGNTPQLFATCVTREKNISAKWNNFAIE